MLRENHICEVEMTREIFEKCREKNVIELQTQNREMK